MDQTKQINVSVDTELIHGTCHHQSTLKSRSEARNNRLNGPRNRHGNGFRDPRKNDGYPFVIVVGYKLFQNRSDEAIACLKVNKLAVVSTVNFVLPGYLTWFL